MTHRIRATEPRDAGEIVKTIRDYLAEFPEASLLESGSASFALSTAQYTLAESHGRAVLHIWSEHANLVRRIVSATRRGDALRLMAQRFGQAQPQPLELAACRESQPPGERAEARRHFVRVIERTLAREFPDWQAEGLRAAMDLEHSFGPAYVRGQMTQAQRAWAVIAVGHGESLATVDGILTAGILWLVRCREQAGGRRLFQGLRVIVPGGQAATTLSRVSWLDPRIARYEVYELDARAETLIQGDPHDRGNLATRLVHAPDEAKATSPEGRFAEAIPQVLALLPDEADTSYEAAKPAAHRKQRETPSNPLGFEMRLRSSAELAFLRHGLEFARIRSSYSGQSFNRALEITVGAGASETLLTRGNQEEMRALIAELFRRRKAAGGKTVITGTRKDPLFRLQPERWLESLLRADPAALDPALAAEPVYVQVPAIAGANDRGMLDLLTVTTSHRLAVIEVKADEDMQLAMQGLDYWIRVRDHHLANVDPATGLGDLQQHGYFPHTRLSAEPPLLYLVAPALRIHSATETILRHFDPRIRWTLIALDERWRTRIRPVWRKRNSDRGALV